jgi:hypothetical protein
MIKEAYVSFEIAKLLKDKGFDEELRTYYDNLGNERALGDDFSDIKNSDTESSTKLSDYLELYCTRPTQQMVMCWLRKTHNLFIGVELGVSAYVWTITDMTNNVVIRLDAVVGDYEDVIEAAIKYCLGII